ncbi:5-hydroxytryptamine receptor 3A-like [Mastacembelus armatus]|uniref:5-hydroxytryptamine receptor 3A-like n=1 Tax=Mastacembelus armatus TaxID=205130 RepID=UPI000E456D74|nr:5-hydroxytryptamine receptor 3A-like [Mastacembelus armatus]
MLLTAFFLLLLTDGASSQGNCSYQAVLKHLNLTKNNELFYMTRPVNNHTTSTEVNLDVLLYAILEMVKKDQKFVPYVWITMWWHSDYIGWDPDDFCGIQSVSVPTELMWKPDLTIEEMIERDKAPPSPYLTITHRGNVEFTNDQVLVSTCRMQVYKFPFDTQICNLSFKSIIHSVREMSLKYYYNSSKVTEESREVMRTQYEWLFISMEVSDNIINNYGFDQNVVVYTIKMERRSALYVINFLLPVLFFLCLDLASFLISDSGGEKLSFKVTVLLAVTVLQLILNEILPSSSNKIPLIALYCIGTFALMMLSLLETILVMYLMEKDSASQDNSKDQSLFEDKEVKAKFHSYLRDFAKLIHSACHSNGSPGKTASELQPVDIKGGSIQMTEETLYSEQLSDETLKTLILLLNSMKAKEKPGYWIRMTKRINKVFFIFYVTTASMFLLYMTFKWNSEQH